MRRARWIHVAVLVDASISARYHRVMGAGTTAELLRARRLAAGLSQRQLAARAHVAQPNIAAYETGRRTPTAQTLARLDAVLRVPTLQLVRRHRAEVIAAATARHLGEVRVFGSVARGDAGVESDVDLLVHPAQDASVFDLAGFMSEVEEILGSPVDVVSDRGHGAALERIRAEAVAL